MKLGVVTALFTLCFILGHALYAGNNNGAQELFDLTFEELLNLEITTGTYTGIERTKTPLSLYSIDRDDIDMTPARNILDLIEVYVPGATFVNHWLGPRLGFRGVLGDQNNSYLLLVNGVNVNLKSFTGLVYEIDIKDLGDIDRIDVINGPGTVTYGPGAIGGIINIVTKNAATSPGLGVKLEGNLLYRYGIVSASYGYTSKNYNAYIYGSLGRSKGNKDTEYFYVDRAYDYGYGFMGPDWGNKGLGTPATNLYEDFWDKPEIKLHADVRFYDQWRLWARFTTFNYTSLQQESITADGPHFPGQFGKMFLVGIENNRPLTSSITLNTSLGFTSKSQRHVRFYQADNQVADHIAQREYSFSENEADVDVRINYHPLENFNAVLGSAFYYQYMAPEWGMDDKSFILNFPAPIRFAVLDSLSRFHRTYGPNGLTTVIDDRIDGSQVSFFGEVNYKLQDKVLLLLSSRADKHKYSTWAFSPRVALIYTYNPRNIIKVIGQRSVRLANFTELYTEERIMDRSASPEKLDGVEIIFNRIHNENMNFSLSAFYDNIEQLAWFLKDDRQGNMLLGALSKIGLETQLSYKDQRQYTGVSYSFVHQLDWDPATDIQAWLTGSEGETVLQSNYGDNRINNVPKHQLKMFGNYKLKPDLRLHVNGRMYWDFQQKQMLDSFIDAENRLGIPEYIREMNAITSELHDQGYTRPSFTLNTSIAWQAPVQQFDCYLQLYAMNLLSVNHVRYVFQYWEPGNNRQFPRQCAFLKEPLAVGIKVTADF